MWCRLCTTCKHMSRANEGRKNKRGEFVCQFESETATRGSGYQPITCAAVIRVKRTVGCWRCYAGNLPLNAAVPLTVIISRSVARVAAT